MKKFLTYQEKLWKGKFGDDYIDRNKSDNLLSSKIFMFSQIINSTEDIKSVFEIGSNIGLNLVAINKLLPSAKLHGIELNKKAYNELAKINYINSYYGSFLNFNIDITVDFVFTCTLLIHIDPSLLCLVYDKIAKISKRYVLMAEYYSPNQQEIIYRGKKDCLFKGDFAGEFLEKHKEFKLVDYSFIYHKDNTFPIDDITWFLMEKK